MKNADSIAYIGIGSNIGSREEHLQEAVSRLEAIDGVSVTRASSVYETEPWGKEDQEAFLNAVVEVSSSLGARELHVVLKAIEDEMGREQTERYGPRRIDLDLLLFESDVIEEEQLQVPHPRMHQRRFVLVPLAEIAADVRHPVMVNTMNDLLATCPDMGRVWKHSWSISDVPDITDRNDG